MQGTCGWYWSSSPVGDFVDSRWAVSFDGGRVSYGLGVPVDTGTYVRCVR